MSRTIEWYRISPLKGVVIVAIIAFSIMISGVFIIAFGLDNSGRVPQEWQPWMLSSGMCIVIISICIACYGFFRVLSKEGTFLEVKTDGLLYKTEIEEHLYHWQLIENIEFQGGQLLIQAEGEPLLRIEQDFLGISGSQLAERLLEVQRKALLGMTQ